MPSGNFGNVCAGHVARMMACRLAAWIVATNENDVLDEFFRTGGYRPRGSGRDARDLQPSMDISGPNFERFIADLLAAMAIRPLLQRQHASGRRARQDCRLRLHFCRSTHADRVATIQRCHAEFGVIIDPHTADGLKVTRGDPGETVIVLGDRAARQVRGHHPGALNQIAPRPAASRASRLPKPLPGRAGRRGHHRQGLPSPAMPEPRTDDALFAQLLTDTRSIAERTECPPFRQPRPRAGAGWSPLLRRAAGRQLGHGRLRCVLPTRALCCR